MTTGKTTTGIDFLRRQQRKITTGEPLEVSEQKAASVQIEAWLQRHNVQYAPPMMIPMTAIDEKRSRQNQARKEPIVQDSVDRYTLGYKEGDAFPPIVGYTLGGRFVIIDGNNRQAAAKKAGCTEIWAIMIAADTPSELIQYLTIEANAHHGKSPEVEWRIRQAFQLMGFGYDLEKAAKAVQINPQTLRNARAAQEADQRARAMKIQNFSELPSTSKQMLNVLKDDPVFFQAASVAVRTKMTVEDIRLMIKEIKSQRSEGEKLTVIGRLADERNEAEVTRKALGKKTSMTSPAHSLSSAAGKLVKIDPALLVRQILTTADRDIARKHCKDLEEKLLEIQVALEQLDDLDDADG